MMPAVVTSRQARKDLDNIRAKHSLLLEGMATHAVRMDAQNQQKAVEMQNQQAMKAEMDKSKMVADTTASKNTSDFALKQQELDIKRQALSLPE